MKPRMLAIAALISFTSAFANDATYVETMTRYISQVYTASTQEELLQAVNAFERVGNAEKVKWEPFYYASFGYVMVANREQDLAKKDAYLDQAKLAIDRASAIISNESEVVTMEGFVNMIRVTVDPANRGQKYSGLAMQQFGKAIALNPENPRAHALMAQMQFGVAKFFNGPTDEACTSTRKAVEKFNSFKPANELAPRWGKGMTEGLLTQCK